MSMTTLVQSPPSFQSQTRWDGLAGFTMSTEDVSRMLLPQRKVIQRSNSSSSLSSNNSITSTNTVTSSNDSSFTSNSDGPAPIKRKPRGGFWPVSKAEPTSSLTKTNGAVQQAAVNGTAQSNDVQSPASDANAVTPTAPQPAAVLKLIPTNGIFEQKTIHVPMHPEPPLKIGRQTNAKTHPKPDNGYFDSKVLSRMHAEVWCDRDGTVWIRDVKSSNGTFVNGRRLSPESRESEPTKLQTNDILELGIDIVSEDQKTVVHHKVAAKVGFAGFEGKPQNSFDILSFGTDDNSARGGPMMRHGQQGRPLGSRTNSLAGSIASNVGSAVAQRQAQVYGLSLNLEQLVRQVNQEMRAARQQAADLEHANTFLHSILPTDNSPVKAGHMSTRDAQSPSKQNNSRIKGHSARISGPPAPPPQQPLPEKPDGKASTSEKSILSDMLKSQSTEKVLDGATVTPNFNQSQILTLVAELKQAQKAIEEQSNKMKELEEMLEQEKSAREAAESRVRQMELINSSRPISQVVEDMHKAVQQEEETPTVSYNLQETNPAAQSLKEALLQQQLDAVLLRITNMESTLTETTKRADTAESEKSSLLEMIEYYRSQNTSDTTDTLKKESMSDSAISEMDSASSTLLGNDNVDGSVERAKTFKDTNTAPSMNGHVRGPSLPKHLQEAVSSVLAMQARSDETGVMNTTGPMISMLGVVLVGVGLMAYMNQWQKGER